MNKKASKCLINKHKLKTIGEIDEHTDKVLFEDARMAV